MSWVDAKAKYDHGSRLIRVGLELMQEYLDMMKDEEKDSKKPEEETVGIDKRVCSTERS